MWRGISSPRVPVTSSEIVSYVPSLLISAINPKNSRKFRSVGLSSTNPGVSIDFKWGTWEYEKHCACSSCFAWVCLVAAGKRRNASGPPIPQVKEGCRHQPTGPRQFADRIRRSGSSSQGSRGFPASDGRDLSGSLLLELPVVVP